MRIRKHSRITALILALVMILPLISIPTFAEDTVAPTPITWSEDFDDATSIDDVTASGVNDRTLVDGALKIPLQGYDDGSVYVRKNKSGSYIKATGNATDGYVATVDGVEYTLKGTVNNTALAGWVAATSVTPTPPSGTTLYLACAAAADLYDGFKGNIAKNTYFKHGAISADYDMVTYTANYFVSSDFYSGSSLKFYNGNYLKYAQATIDSVNVSFKNHGDISDGNTSLKEIKVQKGQWFELKVVFDRVSGRFTLYVDGQLCNVNSTQAAKVKAEFAADSLGIFEIVRYINDPSAKGYVLIDNVSVTTEGNGHFGTIDFESMEGITAFSGNNATFTSVSASGVGKNFNHTPPTTLTAVTENDNTYLKFDYDLNELMKTEAHYKVTATAGDDGVIPNDKNGDGLVDYYAYYSYVDSNSKTQNVRWEKNASIKSYDATNKVLTLTDGSTYNVTAASNGNIALGYYGTFKYTSPVANGEVTCNLTTPNYAVYNTWGGHNGAMDKNVSIRIPYVSHATSDEVYLSAKYYIAPGSHGTAQSQLSGLLLNDALHGKGWSALYSINLADGLFTPVTTKNGVKCPIGDWFEIGMRINLDTGLFTFYVDDVYAGTTAFSGKLELANSTTDYGGTAWILAKMQKTETSINARGYIAFDDLTMTDVSAAPDRTYFVNEDFNSPYALGKAPTQEASGIPSFNSVAVADSVVTDAVGSPAWKIDFDRTNTTVDGHSQGYNANKNSTVKHPASTALEGDTVVFEASYFIDSDARGQIQSQLMTITVDPAIPDLDGSKYKYEVATDATENPTNFKRKNTASWADLYVIKFYQDASNSEIVLTRESGTRYNPNASAPLRAEVWNTITVVLTRSTGMLKYYINGEFAFEDQLNAAAGADVSKTKNNEAYKNVGFAANQWIVGKVNHLGTSGTFYIDDLKMYEGTAPTVTPEVDTDRVYDFEEFKYVNDGDSAVFGGFTSAPQLLTFKKEANGNTALRLDMGPSVAHNRWVLYRADDFIRGWDVAYTDGATQLSYGGNNYDILIDEANGLPYIEITESEKDKEGNPVVTKNYIVPGDWAETSAGYSRGNVATATSFAHDTFSYETTPTVVFAADYLIEAGSTGIIESQFSNATGVKKDATGRSSTGFLQLFHLYMEDGLVTGQGGVNHGYKVKTGEWVKIKVVANLVTGVFNIYADGILVRTYDCGYTNLELTQDWSFAKVKRAGDIGNTKENFKGGVLIDNVSIGVEEFEHSESYGPAFLKDEIFEEYTKDLIVGLGEASIRFNTPHGLRFGSIVNTQKLSYLKAIYDGATVKMGTLITPKRYLTNNGANELPTTINRATLDAIERTNKYIDVELENEAYFSGHADFVAEEGVNYMVGSITNILASNLTQEFVGIGYIEFTIGDVTYGIYTDATVRSVQAVAEACMADPKIEYTEYQQMLLNIYASGMVRPEDIPAESWPTQE